MSEVIDPRYGIDFGRHVRSLRRARGLTQPALAFRADLSSDTIRRLEHGSFSPSLDTIRKLCHGLDLTPAGLFAALEVGHDDRRELLGLLARRSDEDVEIAVTMLRALFEALDGSR